MIKIRQTKRNIMYLIIGRILTAISIYIMIEILTTKALLYIINNCITTIK